MSGKEVPFWEAASWTDYAHWYVRLNTLPGEDWIAARFALGSFTPEQLFFHTCGPRSETETWAPNGYCKNCGDNIPMEYLRKATFIDRIQGYGYDG